MHCKLIFIILIGRRSHHARCRYPMALMENGDRVGTTEFSENLNISPDENFIAQAPRASPEISEMDISLHQCCSSNRASIQRLSIMSNSFNGDNNNGALSSEVGKINTLIINLISSHIHDVDMYIEILID